MSDTTIAPSFQPTSSPTETPTASPSTNEPTSAPTLTRRASNNSNGMVLSPWRLGNGAFAEHQCMIMSTSLSLNPDYDQLSKMYCWGQNKFGQLGGVNLKDDKDLSDFASVNLGQRPGFPVQVAVGEKHTCVLMSTHKVLCWGSNKARALGSETIFGTATEMGDALMPLDLGPLIDETTFEARIPMQIAAGLDHTCVVFSNGSIRCWGSNEYGQLGFDTNGVSTSFVNARDVELPDGIRAEKLSLGKFSTCASVTTPDKPGLYCWGSNDEEILDRSWEPTNIDMENLNINRITHISSTSSFHYVALIVDEGETSIKRILINDRKLDTNDALNLISLTPSSSAFNQMANTPSSSMLNTMAFTPSSSTLNQMSFTPSSPARNLMADTPSSSDFPLLLTTGKGLVCVTSFEADVGTWSVKCVSEGSGVDNTGLLKVDGENIPKSIVLRGGLPLSMVGTKDNVYLITANDESFPGLYGAAGSNAEGQLGIRKKDNSIDDTTSAALIAPWDFNFPSDGIFESDAFNNTVISVPDIAVKENPTNNDVTVMLSFASTFGVLLVVLFLVEVHHRVTNRGVRRVKGSNRVLLNKRRSSWLRSRRSNGSNEAAMNPRWVPITIE